MHEVKTTKSALYRTKMSGTEHISKWKANGRQL